MKSIRSTTTVSLDLLKACVVQMNLRQWLPRRKSRLGRPSYEPLALFLAVLLKIRENIKNRYWHAHNIVRANLIKEQETLFFNWQNKILTLILALGLACLTVGILYGGC